MNTQTNCVTCPCWDPWRIGCKRIKRAKTGTMTQMTKSYPVGAEMKDQMKPKISLKLASPSKMTCVIGAHRVAFRKREPQDIAKEFIELPPDFPLSPMKRHQTCLLEQESSFEVKRPANEAFSKPVLASTPPKLQTEDIVADLVEQISELTAIMEQLRRDHETDHKQLENEMEEKCNKLLEEHGNKVRQMETQHRKAMESLEEHFKKELRAERATAQEKLSGMQKEYKYLKNAFRVYQDSISDEMEEKWLRRQAEWKKSERTEREKALLQQKQSLTRKFELELEEHQKLVQRDSFLIGKAYQAEKQDFLKQREEDLEKMCALREKVEALETELRERNETLNAIASTLHNTEMELQHEKTTVVEMEKMVQQRMAAFEEKHRSHVNTLVEENACLRRKLIEKNEEILNERNQRNVLF